MLKMRRKQESDSGPSMGRGALEVHFPIGSLCINKHRDAHIIVLRHIGDYRADVLENDKQIQMTLYVLLTYWENIQKG